MKSFILLSFNLILLCFSAKAQHTPETAPVITTWGQQAKSATINDSSFGNPVPGLNYGLLNNTNRLAWFLIPVCDTLGFQFHYAAWLADTAGCVVYGPFTDTLQILSKLQAATPVASRPYLYQSIPQSLYVGNFGTGLYLAAVNIGHFSGNVNITATSTNPQNYKLCDYCNNAIYQDQMFCLVTTDSATQRTKLIFENTDTANIRGYIIYRENNIAGQYDSLTYIPVDSSNYFIDMTANPATRNWRYMMHRLDRCGQRLPVYFQGNGYFWKANTLHLQQGISTNNSINLTWNNVINNNPILGNCCFYPSIYIYRSDGQSTFVAIDSIPTNISAYTDVNPLQGLNLYQVVMLKTSACTITRANETEARSNTISVTFTGLDDATNEIAFNVFPNPASHQVRVELPFSIGQWKLEIISPEGKTVFKSNGSDGGNKMINLESLQSGFYQLSLSTADKVYYRKLIIN